VTGTLPRLAPRGAALLATGFLAVGLFGVYRYVANYWLYRGFAPPHDAAFVKTRGTASRFYLASAALGGRRQPVDVYLPPGYAAHPHRRYPVMYLLHGVPGRPGAFLATVRMGVVEDELVALHRARPAILVMPFGSTGSFTDKEWANGVGKGNRWATFVARDVVEAGNKR
jgi:enterochelin esterase-like enzyme